MRILFLRPLCGALSLCVLSACSSDSPTTSSSEGTVQVAGPVAEAVTNTGGDFGATVLATTAVVASSNPFANFDFANGTRLPDRAVLSIGTATYAPGSQMAYVPVSLDRPTPNTVIARLTTVNGSGSNKAISGIHYAATSVVLIFRPGDPLTQTVAVPILASVQGQQFNLKLSEAPWGAAQGTANAAVTADAAKTPTSAADTGFRAPRSFKPTGTLQFDMTKASMRWSDAGHAGAWSTKLPNGRSQPANGETGMYLDGYVYPGVEAPLRYTDEGLVMHTQVLKTPLSWAGVAYRYGSVVLSGHNTPMTQIGYGQYEWVAKMPSRRGSWPAFWLIAKSGWPPEIDVYEGFGYQDYFDLDRHISSTIHGGANAVRSFQRGSVIQAEQAYQMKGFTQGFHSFAVDIQPDYITWFVDGQETYQSVNPFRGTRFYPIMDVAVKTTGAYAEGSGDMIVKSFRAYAN